MWERPKGEPAEGLEEVGFAFAVAAHQQVDRRGELQLSLGEVAEVLEGGGEDAHFLGLRGWLHLRSSGRGRGGRRGRGRIGDDGGGVEGGGAGVWCRGAVPGCGAGVRCRGAVPGCDRELRV
jgi:hypothetical protein